MATEPRWLDKTEMAAWHSLVVAGMHMFAALDRDLRDAFDVTLLDHGILLMLRNSPDGLTMGHLAGQFGTEASVITYRVKRLEKKGLAERRRCDDDRRLVHAVITRAGEKLCDRMGPVHVASVRSHFLDYVPRKDLPAVGDAFDHLYAAQHRDPTNDGGS
ncbi:MAG: MarR family transcriptional regulator [Actinomycetes bacterium]